MKRALIVGCAKRVWADVETAEEFCKFDTVYCVKHAGTHWDGGPFIWITLHPEFMKVERIPTTGEPGYCLQRAALGLHSDYKIVAPRTDEVGMHGHHKMDRHETYRWEGMSASGSSGLFAVKIAIDDGHDRLVLAGIPMTTEDDHFMRGKPWLPRDSFMIPWESHARFYKDKTRSVSGGWTEKFLGRPTPEWLGVSPGATADATSAITA